MFKALPVGIAALAAMFLLFGSGALPAEAASTVLVTNNNDSGPGSFRAAVDQANNDSNVNVIKFLVAGPINLQSDVEYDGGQALTLSGLFNTTVIQESNVAATGDAGIACHTSGLFESTGGADLTLLSLTFQNNSCGSGVFVDLYDEGDVSIMLNRVVLRGNDGDGLHIREDSECSGSTNISLTVLYSTFSGNDDDGIEVDDRGNGDVSASLKFSHFRDNDEDGFDILEDCDGNVSLTTLSSTFNDNDDEGIDVDENGEGNADLTLNGLDASRNGDDGVDAEEQESTDLSLALSEADGDDAEEHDASADGPQAASCHTGDLTLTVNGGRANDNDSDGFDIDENDCGSLYATFTAVVASGNAADGFDLDESSDGDLDVTARSATTADNNGGDSSDGNGFRLFESGYGSVYADFSSTAARFNGMIDESGDGIDIEEHDDGSLELNMGLSVVLSNRDDGVDLEEFDCGDLDATLVSSTVSLNADDGIDAEQDDCGGDTGELTLIFTSVIANGDQNLELDGVVLN